MKNIVIIASVFFLSSCAAGQPLDCVNIISTNGCVFFKGNDNDRTVANAKANPKATRRTSESYSSGSIEKPERVWGSQ